MRYSYILILSAFVALPLSSCGEDPVKPGDTKTAGAHFQEIFPCWRQHWRCGKWRPLEGELDDRYYAESTTPDGKRLLMSTCRECTSLRIVDPDVGMQRVIGMAPMLPGHTSHIWRPAVHRGSADPIKEGDIIVLANEQEMYALRILELQLDVSCGEELTFQSADLLKARGFPESIAWKQLPWKKHHAKKKITLGSCEIHFANYREINKNWVLGDAYVSIEYEHYYGCLSWCVENPTRVAIIHAADFLNEDHIDLRRFRFKTWEDGLGNLCGQPDPQQGKVVYGPS